MLHKFLIIIFKAANHDNLGALEVIFNKRPEIVEIIDQRDKIDLRALDIGKV